MSASVDVLQLFDKLVRAAHCIDVQPPPDDEVNAGRYAMAMLIAAAKQADGDERPGRPERAPSYSDEEWATFMRGWDACAEAVFRSGLRAAVARIGGGA